MGLLSTTRGMLIYCALACAAGCSPGGGPGGPSPLIPSVVGTWRWELDESLPTQSIDTAMFAGVPDAPPSIALNAGGWAERQPDGTWVRRDYPLANAGPISAQADSSDSAWVSVKRALLRWTRAEGMRVVPLEDVTFVGGILVTRADDVLVHVETSDHSHELRHWNGSSWTRRFDMVGGQGGEVGGMAIEPDGSVLAARLAPFAMALRSSELFRCRGSSCTILRELGPISYRERLLLVKDRSNTIWLHGALGLELRRVGELEFTRVSTVATPIKAYATLFGSGLLALVPQSASSSDNVIVSIDGATATPRPLATVPPMLRGSAIWAESERSLWFATRSGGILHWTSDGP